MWSCERWVASERSASAEVGCLLCELRSLSSRQRCAEALLMTHSDAYEKYLKLHAY